MKNNALRATIFRIRNLMLPKTRGQESWDYIGRSIESDKPFMAARFGAVEIKAVLYAKYPLLAPFLKRYVYTCMHRNAGFFPVSKESLRQFASLMTTDMRQVDVLFSWRPQEIFLKKELQNAYKASFADTNIHPEDKAFWTKYLKGKKVLVIHPFASTIEQQYRENRTKLFARTDFIPKFSSLTTIKAVQTIAGHQAGYKTWFEALDYMKREIEKADFDIALIGCGAYGFPLAAHVKRMGKQAIHLGGVLQIYFGIKGKRWNDWGLYNELWVSPHAEDIPQGAEHVENGCYW